MPEILPQLITVPNLNFKWWLILNGMDLASDYCLVLVHLVPEGVHLKRN